MAPERQFAALADPTRLRLVALLRDGEVCVGDLVRVLGLPQGTVSRHLGRLRRAGLVGHRRAGTWIYYRLAAPLDGSSLRACVDEALARHPPALADAAELVRLRAEGGCCR